MLGEEQLSKGRGWLASNAYRSAIESEPKDPSVESQVQVVLAYLVEFLSTELLGHRFVMLRTSEH